MIDVIITSYLNFSNCYTGRDACAIIAIHMYMHSFILISQKKTSTSLVTIVLCILSHTVRSGQLEIVKYLTEEQGCSARSTGEYKQTPLHFACR